MIYVKVDSVKVKKGRRAVDMEKVDQLVGSIKEIGLIYPIIVDEKCNLVAGAHRLEAFKKLKRTSIQADMLIIENRASELIEIDENLIRSELHYTERADALLRRKEIYEEMYPETKREATLKQNRNEIISERTKPSFVKDTAKKIGRSERTIETEIQIGKSLNPEELKIIKDKNISKTDAIKLARMDEEERKPFIDSMSKGQIKKLKESKERLDPVDEEYDKHSKKIDEKNKRIKKVQNLLDYTQHLGIEEIHVRDYFELFPKRLGFIEDLEKLKKIADDVIQLSRNINQIRRIK